MRMNFHLITLFAFSCLVSGALRDNLAMSASCSVGTTNESVQVNSDYPLVSNIPLHRLSISSPFGMASLVIDPLIGDEIILEHSGGAWVMLLDNNLDMGDATFVYPTEAFMNPPIRRPFKLEDRPPTGKAITRYGHFLLGVPLTNDHAGQFRGISQHLFKMLSASLNDHYAHYYPALGGSMDIFHQRFGEIFGFRLSNLFGKGKVALIYGRFVSPSKQSLGNLIENYSETSHDRSVEQVGLTLNQDSLTFRHPSMMPPRVEPPYTLGTPQHWNLHRLARSEVSGNDLIYFSQDYQNAASVALSQGSNRLVYQQSGLANVLVFRPIVGLIFPSREVFLDRPFYTAIENAIPTEIDGTLIPGDLIVIVMPIDWLRGAEINPRELINYIENSTDLEPPLRDLQSFVKDPQDVFISISKIEQISFNH